MPPATWNRLLDEIGQLQAAELRNPPAPGQPNAFDRFRRSKISGIEVITARPLIVYASACTSPKEKAKATAFAANRASYVDGVTGVGPGAENVAVYELPVNE